MAEALRMEVVEDEGSKGKEGGGVTLRALGALELLTQEAEPSGTTLVDARNGFNKLSRLVILWTVQHRWLAGARFAFNCYQHWAQLLLRQSGELPVTILSIDGVTQGDPLSMVFMGSPSSPSSSTSLIAVRYIAPNPRMLRHPHRKSRGALDPLLGDTLPGGQG